MDALGVEGVGSKESPWSEFDDVLVMKELEKNSEKRLIGGTEKRSGRILGRTGIKGELESRVSSACTASCC